MGRTTAHGDFSARAIDVGQTTVAKYMVDGNETVVPGCFWKTFLHSHADGNRVDGPIRVPTISFPDAHGLRMLHTIRRPHPVAGSDCASDGCNGFAPLTRGLWLKVVPHYSFVTSTPSR